MIAALFVVIFIVLKRRMSGSPRYKYAVALSLASAFLLFWGNGAVGIIGTAENDANMMYYGVLGVGGLGGLISRFRPEGMALTMLAAALAMVLVGAIALITRSGSAGPIWPWDILAATGIFVVLFVESALLFRQAAQDRSF